MNLLTLFFFLHTKDVNISKLVLFLSVSHSRLRHPTENPQCKQTIVHAPLQIHYSQNSNSFHKRATKKLGGKKNNKIFRTVLLKRSVQ